MDLALNLILMRYMMLQYWQRRSGVTILRSSQAIVMQAAKIMHW